LYSCHWELGSLPQLQGRFSVPPPPPLLELDYNSFVYVFQFSCVWGGSSLPSGCARLFSLGGGDVGTWCSLVPSAVLCKQLWSQLAGRNDTDFFSVQCS
jgi:hypothetical protein